MGSLAQLWHPAHAELAEGPVWHGNALWWVEIISGTLNRLDAAQQEPTSRPTGDLLGCAVPCSDGHHWMLGQRQGFARLDWRSGMIVPIATLSDPQPRQRLNDGKCDPLGRLLAGTLDLDGERGRCSLHGLGPEGCRPLLGGLSLSNGLAWSRDGSQLFLVDTLERTLTAYAYDLADGLVGAGRVLVRFDAAEGFPDGMAADAEDGLWIAMWGVGQVLRVAMADGRITHRLRVPTTQPSSVCFIGDRLDELAITSAWQGMTPGRRAADPLAGGIFRHRPGFTGFHPSPYRVGTP